LNREKPRRLQGLRKRRLGRLDVVQEALHLGVELFGFARQRVGQRLAAACAIRARVPSLSE
jgi:hypothetical protein